MSFTQPPQPPSRSDPTNFSAEAEAFCDWLVVFAAELQAMLPGESAAGLAQNLISSAAGKGSALIDFSRALTVGGKLTAPKAEINGTSDTGTPDASLRVTGTLAGLLAGGGHGIRVEHAISSGVAGTGYAAFDGQYTLTATGFDHVVTYQSRPIVTGNPTHIYAMTHAPVLDAGAHAVNNYGFFAFNPTGAGLLDNNYGFYIPQMTKGTNNWAGYIAQQGAPFYCGAPIEANSTVSVGTAPFIVGAASAGNYPFCGYNFNPLTGKYTVSDFAATIKWEGGMRFQMAASGTGGAACAPVDTVVFKLNGSVRFVPMASAPASPQAGDVYFDSTLAKLRCYDGAAWANLH